MGVWWKLRWCPHLQHFGLVQGSRAWSAQNLETINSNVNPGLINHGWFEGYSRSHDLIFFYGTFPIKQPFGVYESRVDITTYQPNLFHHFTFHLNRPKPPGVLCFLLNRATTDIHRSGARPNASRCITSSSNYIDIFHSIPRQTYGTFFLSPT